MEIPIVLSLLISFLVRHALAVDTTSFLILENKYQLLNNGSTPFLGIDNQGGIRVYGLNDTSGYYYAACVWRINSTDAASGQYRINAQINQNNFLAVQQSGSTYTPHQLIPGASGSWVGVPRGSWDIWEYKSDNAIALRQSDINQFLSIDDDGVAIMADWDNTTTGNPKMIWYPRVGMIVDATVTSTITRSVTRASAGTTVSASQRTSFKSIVDFTTVTRTVSTTAARAVKRDGKPTLTGTSTVFVYVTKQISTYYPTLTISGNQTVATTSLTSTITQDLTVTVAPSSTPGSSTPASTSSSTAGGGRVVHTAGSGAFVALLIAMLSFLGLA